MSTPSQASIDAFRGLNPDQQRTALASMSTETKQALLAGLQSGAQGGPAASAAPPANVPPPPGFFGRASEMLGLTAHPLDQAKSEYEQFKSHPVQSIVNTVKAPVIGARDLAYNLVTNPLDTIKEVTGGNRFAEDVQNKNYAGAAGTLVGGGAQAALSALGGEKAPPTSVEEATSRALPAAQAAELAAQPKAPLTQRIAQATLNVGPKMTERAVKEATDAYESTVSKILDKSAQQMKDWREATVETKGANAAARSAVDRRAAILRGTEQLSQNLGDGIKALEQKVRAEGNARYATVAQKVGEDSVPASTLAPAIENAQTNIIKGSPESIKQFRDLLQRGGDSGAVKTSMGELSPDHPLYQTLKDQGVLGGGENLTFDNLRGYSSELGSRLAAGNLPGDVYQAIKSVKGAIDDQIAALAKKHGAEADLRDANQYWARYKDTFYNTDALAKGGSPVAAALSATDPTFYSRPFSGPAGTRGVEMLAQYDPRLAQLARNTAKFLDEAKALPKVAKEKALPERPATPGLPPPPTVDPQALKAQRIEQLADSWRKWSKYDPVSLIIGSVELLTGGKPYALLYAPGHMSLGMLMEQPKVLEWLSRPQPGDFAALEKLPGAAQSQLRSAITQKLASQAAKGAAVPLTTEMRAFLGQNGVRAIAAAQATQARQLKGVPPPPGASLGSGGAPQEQP